MRSRAGVFPMTHHVECAASVSDSARALYCGGYPEQAEVYAVLTRTDGLTLVLALPAQIETGNHIAQVPDGNARRSLAQTLGKIMAASAEGQAPWKIYGGERGSEWVSGLAGGFAGESLADLASIFPRFDPAAAH